MQYKSCKIIYGIHFADGRYDEENRWLIQSLKIFLRSCVAWPLPPTSTAGVNVTLGSATLHWNRLRVDCLVLIAVMNVIALLVYRRRRITLQDCCRSTCRQDSDTATGASGASTACADTRLDSSSTYAVTSDTSSSATTTLDRHEPTCSTTTTSLPYSSPPPSYEEVMARNQV